MSKYTFILSALLFSAIVLRADLVIERVASDTGHTRPAVLKLHGDKMRLDQPGDDFSVIVDLNTRDSITLLTKEKMFLKRSGTEIREQMAAEKKSSAGTNAMDQPPAQAVDTGKSETVNARDTEIFNWSGAHGLTETLWVDKRFANYDVIRTELAKIDRFNDSGPHRNAQPGLSRLPGMVIKSKTTTQGQTVTNTLVSVKVEPVDESLFELPADYSPWKPVKKQP